MTLTLVIGTIAVTSAGAGGRADSSRATGTVVEASRDRASDPPADYVPRKDYGALSERNRVEGGPDTSLARDRSSARFRSESDPVAYWHRLAVKRLRLLGARERRIVRLLRRIHGTSNRGGDSRSPSGSRTGASVRSVICTVFGAHCSEALRVAWCESRFNVYATNGQYKGLFQMGKFARAKYGHSWNAWGQSRSAYRYFLDAGWSPWACKP